VTKAHVKRTIEQAFYAIARKAESGIETDKLLRGAYQAALEGERAHRKMGRALGGYQQSAETAARYFVAKWFAEPSGQVSSARDACAMRLDCLYAMALRECLDSEGKTVDLGEDFAAIDYTAHIVA
jgi:hypothetical protein